MPRLLTTICCLCLCGSLWAAVPTPVPPADPPWAMVTSADTANGEAQLTPRIVQDRYGYYAVLQLSGWQTDGHLLRFRYIPTNTAPVTMPLGVPSGRDFQFGSPEWELQRQAAESPMRSGATALGTLSATPNGYWMSEGEITQAIWHTLYTSSLALQPGEQPYGGPLPSNADYRPDDPVTHVCPGIITSWLTKLNQDMASDYAALSPPPSAPLLSARLPSEAEWEHACRAGTTTPLWNGYTAEPIEFMPALLDGTRQHKYGGNRGDSYSDISDVIRREWDNQSAIASQESYLKNFVYSKSDTYWAKASYNYTSSRKRLQKARARIKVTYWIDDYFQFEAIGKVVANCDSRYRPTFVPDIVGTHVPIRKRYRRIDDNTYVEDPTTLDSEVYFRFRHSTVTQAVTNTSFDPATEAATGTSSVNIAIPTPDADFVRYAAARGALDPATAGNTYPAYDSNCRFFWEAGEEVDPAWRTFNHRDGIRYRHTDNQSYDIELMGYQTTGDRYRAISADPDPEDSSHFVHDINGVWCKTSYGSYERFQLVRPAAVWASYDEEGFQLGGLMPGSHDILDRDDEVVARWLHNAPLANGVSTWNDGSSNVVLDTAKLQSTNSMISSLIQDIRSRYVNSDGTDTVYNSSQKIYANHKTHWYVELQTTVRWVGASANASADGDPYFQCIEVKPIDKTSWQANPWGLYNVHGNVAEWTSTPWNGSSRHGLTTLRPAADGWVVKGGSWRQPLDHCRSARREKRIEGTAFVVGRDAVTTLKPGYDDVGFRIMIPAN